jgi:hypothetical protein
MNRVVIARRAVHTSTTAAHKWHVCRGRAYRGTAGGSMKFWDASAIVPLLVVETQTRQLLSIVAKDSAMLGLAAALKQIMSRLRFIDKLAWISYAQTANLGLLTYCVDIQASLPRYLELASPVVEVFKVH